MELDLAKGLKLNMPGRAVVFFKETLLPAAERLADLRKKGAEYQRLGMLTVQGAAESMRWVHPTSGFGRLLWYSKGHHDDATLQFFRKLERLVWMMRLAGFDPVKQQTRIIQVLGEIDAAADPTKMRSLEISPEMKADALESLRAPSFDQQAVLREALAPYQPLPRTGSGPHPSGPLDARACAAQGLQLRPVMAEGVSVAQVGQGFGACARKSLTFLTAAENQAADMALVGDEAAALCALQARARQPLGMTQQWTADSIKSRTEELIRILFQSWELKA